MLLRRIFVGLAAVLAALGVFYLVLVESGEVVVLETRDAAGAHETRLWVVDEGGAAWLRTGDPTSPWLARLPQRPAEPDVAEGAPALSADAVQAHLRRRLAARALLEQRGLVASPRDLARQGLRLSPSLGIQLAELRDRLLDDLATPRDARDRTERLLGGSH